MRVLAVTVICAALTHGSATPALAQTSVTPLDFVVSGPPPAGWSFTPALDYAFLWDSNVLIVNTVSDEIAEQVHVFKPRASASYDGRRTRFASHYSGAFVQHPTLSSLNSYDQRGAVNTEHLLTRRLSLFGIYEMATAPTTELVEIPDVPFSRIGTRRQDARAGLTAKLSRRTELTGAYRFEWVQFDQDPNLLVFLNGGQSHGGVAGLRHALDARLTLTADYDLQRATVIDGQTFTLQNALGGVEYRLTEDLRVSGSAGMSLLSGITNRPGQRGPAVRVGIARQIDSALLSASYSRSFVPSYGFGGTSDNEELTTQLQLPIARRFLTRAAFALRRNEPLEATDLDRRSLWFHGSVGYLLTDWARVEVFSGGSRQDTYVAGGRVDRYTFGVQLTAATTTRIR